MAISAIRDHYEKFGMDVTLAHADIQASHHG
jgi:hypothetical protein